MKTSLAFFKYEYGSLRDLDAGPIRTCMNEDRADGLNILPLHWRSSMEKGFSKGSLWSYMHYIYIINKGRFGSLLQKKHLWKYSIREDLSVGLVLAKISKYFLLTNTSLNIF